MAGGGPGQAAAYLWGPSLTHLYYHLRNEFTLLSLISLTDKCSFYLICYLYCASPGAKYAFFATLLLNYSATKPTCLQTGRQRTASMFHILFLRAPTFGEISGVRPSCRCLSCGKARTFSPVFRPLRFATIFQPTHRHIASFCKYILCFVVTSM